MSIRALLIANTIGLVVGVIGIVVLFGLLVRSEWKLAKHDESWFFKKKTDGRKRK